MDIRQLNEQLQAFLEEEKTCAWDIFKNTPYKDRLELDYSFTFYFGDNMFHISAEIIDQEQVAQNNKGVYYVLTTWDFGVFNDGKYVDGTLYEPGSKHTMPIGSEYTYVKINAPLKKFTKIEKEVLKIGAFYATSPYGSRSKTCCDFMKKCGIDPDTRYVCNGNIEAASTPSLKYDKERGLYIIIGQHGKGFSNIPITEFDKYCKPETEADVASAVFIAGQD